jgi:hypothetical protein
MPPVYAPPSRPALASKNQQDSQLQLQAQPVRVDFTILGKNSLLVLLWFDQFKLTRSILLAFFQSNESIDAAIGDVLSKPWLPLPLGLKPPSMGSVMGELERQGVANVPQACG